MTRHYPDPYPRTRRYLSATLNLRNIRAALREAGYPRNRQEVRRHRGRRVEVTVHDVDPRDLPKLHWTLDQTLPHGVQRCYINGTFSIIYRQPKAGR